MSKQRRRVNYRRVSTDYQFTESQGIQCDRYINDNGGEWDIIEETVSGSKMAGKALQGLREAVEAGEVAEILVYAYDRLGRNVLEGCKFVELCNAKGVKVTSVCEPYDLTTPEGKSFFVSIMNMAEFFLGRLKRNTKLGLARAKKTCRVCKTYYREGVEPTCECWEPRFVGGSRVGTSWMSKKTLEKLPLILKYLDKGLTHREVKKLVGVDERTVRRVAQQRDNLPGLRERVWDQ